MSCLPPAIDALFKQDLESDYTDYVIKQGDIKYSEQLFHELVEKINMESAVERVPDVSMRDSLKHIFSYLPVQTVIIIRRVCMTWKRVIDAWKERFETLVIAVDPMDCPYNVFDVSCQGTFYSAEIHQPYLLHIKKLKVSMYAHTFREFLKMNAHHMHRIESIEGLLHVKYQDDTIPLEEILEDYRNKLSHNYLIDQDVFSTSFYNGIQNGARRHFYIDDRRGSVFLCPLAADAPSSPDDITPETPLPKSPNIITLNLELWSKDALIQGFRRMTEDGFITRLKTLGICFNVAQKEADEALKQLLRATSSLETFRLDSSVLHTLNGFIDTHYDPLSAFLKCVSDRITELELDLEYHELVQLGEDAELPLFPKLKRFKLRSSRHNIRATVHLLKHMPNLYGLKIDCARDGEIITEEIANSVPYFVGLKEVQIICTFASAFIIQIDRVSDLVLDKILEQPLVIKAKDCWHVFDTQICYISQLLLTKRYSQVERPNIPNVTPLEYSNIEPWLNGEDDKVSYCRVQKFSS